jgi:hypothetical protein
MTATNVIQLPVTRQVAVPSLTRDERRAALETLASNQVTGTPVDAWQALLIASALASASLTPAQAAAKWNDVLGEYARFAGWSADDPDFRDLPGFYEEDLAAALDDLTDGTNRYRGQR